VISSTLRTNSSVERRRATTPNHARITRGPTSVSTASTTAALASAISTSRPRSCAGASSAGTRMSSGTTARSWNSSTPTVSRPWGVSSSSRSARSFETMAVEDIAIAPPSARPACQPAPRACATAMPMPMLATTCAAPRPNTERRMLRSLDRLNSSPIENSRNTTPNSASWRTAWLSATRPSACGPSATPATR
jgi:hypothetical protein